MEDLTGSSKNVERLKDEFYQHAKDYVDKKKDLTERNKHIESKLESEKELKIDLYKQIETFKLNITDLQTQITGLLNDLDTSSRQ